jgi:hypothetical protein
MNMLFHRLVFFLYKMLVRPFHRFPARWSAIVFDENGQFAVEDDGQDRRLPSGEVRPGYPIPDLCRHALGLDQSHFAKTAPLRLVGVCGRAGDDMTFYFSGQIVSGGALTNCPSAKLSFVERSKLGSFVPAEIENSLK